MRGNHVFKIVLCQFKDNLTGNCRLDQCSPSLQLVSRVVTTWEIVSRVVTAWEILIEQGSLIPEELLSEGLTW